MPGHAAGTGLAAALLLSATPAQGRALLEARLGGAWNAPLPIRIAQRGEPEVRITPRWSTRALRPPLYYGVRAGIGDERSGWALDLTHHKLHLENPPAEVEHFEVSHGYNLLVLQRWFARERRTLAVGAGAVIAHPESRVRGEAVDGKDGVGGTGYHVTGPCVDAFAGTRRPWSGRWHVSLEVRATLARARVPIARGSATVPNLALHGTLGLGWRTP